MIKATILFCTVLYKQSKHLNTQIAVLPVFYVTDLVFVTLMGKDRLKVLEKGVLMLIFGRQKDGVIVA